MEQMRLSCTCISTSLQGGLKDTRQDFHTPLAQEVEKLQEDPAGAGRAVGPATAVLAIQPTSEGVRELEQCPVPMPDSGA